ncbi:MAG: hypothetical protein WCS25_06560, partial [Victivallaceae bacterium]
PSGNFMVLTNNTGKTRSVSIDLTGSTFPKSGDLTPYSLTASDKATWSSNKIDVVNFEPWETLIYKVK